MTDEEKDAAVKNGTYAVFPCDLDGIKYLGLTKRELFGLVFTHALIVGGGLESASSEDMARFGIHQATEFLAMLETKKKEEQKGEDS